MSDNPWGRPAADQPDPSQPDQNRNEPGSGDGAWSQPTQSSQPGQYGQPSQYGQAPSPQAQPNGQGGPQGQYGAPGSYGQPGQPGQYGQQYPGAQPQAGWGNWSQPAQPHPSQGQMMPPQASQWGPPRTAPSAPIPTPTQPTRSRIPRRSSTPLVTLSIIGICVLVWLAELSVPGFFGQVAMTPHLAMTQPWRIITSAFAHSTGIMHILFNMYALWALGQGLEYFLGRAKFAALYLLSAIGGSMGYILLASATDGSWFRPVVGASGAVFGLFGALVVVQRHLRQSSQQLWVVLGINALIGFTLPNIAWQAHLGGFLVGMLVGWLLLRNTTTVIKGQADRTWLHLGLVLLALVLLGVAKFAMVG